jgi:two-component system osmolarity sensor histidine kinase EnvZ
MSARAAGGTSLARHNAWWLALVFIVFELLAAVAVVGLLMAPMARRAADDLAGLMLLSAQTWFELPPQTRPDFEAELNRTHMLALRDALPAADGDAWHGFYLHFLEEALAHKTGHKRHFVRERRNGEPWYWVTLPSGEHSIAVGFPEHRVGTQPLLTLAVTLIGGMVLAVVAAIWLARRITEPLAHLEAAVAEVGRGEVPELLPEAGPRELAALAARFNEMARQVRELLAARTTLLAGISHDLRTPLARMRLALALLAEQPNPSRIERLEKDVEAMDELIARVLDLARGLGNEPASDIDLAALAAELRDAAPPGRVRLALPAEALALKAPAVALRRALDNLLENALRYGGAEPVDLVAERAGSGVRIGILDRGPGIPEKQREAVFLPFHRVEGSRSTATGGSGIGLAVVRQLATANGWRIQLKDRPGGGLEAWLIVETS